jgi:AcrR family transcriptional regulator
MKPTVKPRKRNAETTKAAIIKAARRLFARRDIAAVSYRDIAKAAGVSHGLVQHYFGTRDQMIAAIIQNEIEAFGKLLHQGEADRTGLTVENIRTQLRGGALQFHDFARIITRAELAGAKPEKMLDPATPTPAMALADSIQNLQARLPKSSTRMDPRLVSAYINASLFAFAAMAPWLMTSVGLEPKDYEAKRDEITEISIALVSLAAGMAER